MIGDLRLEPDRRRFLPNSPPYTNEKTSSACRATSQLNERGESSSRLLATTCLAYDRGLRRFLIYQLTIRNSAELADDIAQEIYLRLLRFKDCASVQHPQAYLYQIARHVLADKLEIEGHMRRMLVFESDILEKEPGSIDDESDGETFHTYATYQASVDGTCVGIAEHVERTAELEHMLERLPVMHRSVLVMRKCEGKSYSEIANELQISIHTVKKYVHQAIVRCRNAAQDLKTAQLT